MPPDTPDSFYDYLKSLHGGLLTITSFQEGQIVFPNQPLVIVEGPMALVQLIETPLLNLLSFPSLIATNASRSIFKFRFRTLVKDKKLIDMGLRRSQGPNGGVSATMYSYLGGFDGSSNIATCIQHAIPCYGTMAHSFITSF